MKKILFIFVIILSTIIVIFGIKAYTINSDGRLDVSNKMSREEYISLLDKGTTYPNYYYCPNPDDLFAKSEYYIKDGIVAQYVNSKLVSLQQQDTITNIFIDENGEEIISENEIPQTPRIVNQANFDYSITLDTENYDYEYLGEKQENGRTLVIAKFKNLSGKTYIKFYTDKETGLIFKRKDIKGQGFFSDYIINVDRNIKLDVVTDKDIRK